MPLNAFHMPFKRLLNALQTAAYKPKTTFRTHCVRIMDCQEAHSHKEGHEDHRTLTQLYTGGVPL